jgi:hypothetical protein
MLEVPEGPVWTRDENGNSRATVGALVLQPGSKTYGNAWAISQIVNDGGGESTLLRAVTAAELFYAAHAWIRGFEAAQRKEKSLS